MSQTPKTDDAVMHAVSQGMRLAPLAEFARTLERDNAALRAEIVRIREELQAYNRAFDAQPWATDEPAMVLLGKITDRLTRAERTAEEACRNRDEAREEALNADVENTRIRSVVSELNADNAALRAEVAELKRLPDYVKLQQQLDAARAALGKEKP